MVGKTVSHYHIIEKIGEGGMGVVYKAEDTRLKRIVALKFLPPDTTRDSEAKKRFIHEAQAASALDHPNICTIYEIDESGDGQTFIAMAYYDGKSLKERLSRGNLRVEEALEIALQVARGLLKSHEANILHRDIKPANIMMTNDGMAKIVDFGLAKIATTSTTRTLSTMGTVAYMSPEQIQGVPVTLQTDIWALGIVLYEMLAGVTPFDAESQQAVFYKVLNEKPKPITSYRPGVPSEIDRIINKCLEKSTANRYRDAAELITDLGSFVQKASSDYLTEKIGARTNKRVHNPLTKHHKVLAISSVVLVVAGALAYLVFRSEDRFTGYERAYFERRVKEARDKSKSKRSLVNAKAHFYYLLSEYFSNNYELAEEVKEEYRALARNNPDSAAAQFYLGFACLTSSKYRSEIDEAWILINNAENQGFRNCYVSLAKMKLYRSLQLTDELLDLANQTAKEYAEDPYVLVEVADVYQSAAYDKEKARFYLNKSLEAYPRFVYSCLRLAGIALDADEYDRAKEFIDKANRINGKYVGVINAYAEHYQREGRFEKAEEFLLKTIKESDKPDVYYYASLADLYLKQDRIKDGLELVNTALERFPQDTNLLFFSQQLSSRDQWLKAEAKRGKEKGLIIWGENLEDALKTAKREQKPLIVDFYTSWCYWCRILDEKTYPDGKVQAALSSFVPVKLNAEIETKISKKYDLKSFPTLKVLAEDGEEMYEIKGYLEPREFIKSLQEGLLAYRQYREGKTVTAEHLTEVSNIYDAKILAQSKKMPIMAIVSSKESRWSEALLIKTIPYPSLKSALTEIVYLNIEQATNKDLTRRWGIQYYPAVVFLDGSGRVLYKIYGYQPPDALIDLIKKIKSAYQSGTKMVSGIPWMYDLEEAKSFALLQKRDILVNVSSEQVPPCQWYDQHTFSSPSVIETISKDFVPVKLETKRDKEVIANLNIIAVPTLLILDPAGKEVFRGLGYKNPEEFIKFVDIEERKELISIMGHERYREYYRREALAKSLGKLGLYESAINILEKKLVDFPKDSETYIEIAKAYGSLRKAKEAIAYFDKALDAGAKIEKAFLDSYVNLHLQIQDVRGLKEWLDKAIVTNGDNPSTLSAIYLAYSELYEILQDNLQAIQKAKLAVQLGPKNSLAQLQLGRLHYLMNELMDAKRHLLAAKELDAQGPEPCFYLGLVEEKAGDAAGKDKCFNAARDRSKWAGAQVAWRINYQNHPNYYLYPGYLEMIEQALRYTLMLDPNVNINKNNLACFLAYEKKNLDEALDLINSVLKEEPEEWLLLDTKAVVLFQQGHYEVASALVTRYEKLIMKEELESNATLNYWLGRMKLASGDAASARSYFERAIRKKDQNAEGMRWQEEAKTYLSELDTGIK